MRGKSGHYNGKVEFGDEMSHSQKPLSKNVTTRERRNHPTLHPMVLDL